MEYLNERVSYLKGLAEGLGIKEDTKESKIILAIVDVLDEFADAINDIDGSQSELSDYVEDIDEDLADLEDSYYDNEDDYCEIQCPNCNETIYVDRDTYSSGEGVECPNCHEMVEFECPGHDEDTDDD